MNQINKKHVYFWLKERAHSMLIASRETLKQTERDNKLNIM